MPIEKTFDPAEIEARWYKHWEETGAFRPARPHAEPYTIVIPPPNVTGSLHIGHALDNTLQDILIRFERLRGKDALWVVGTDHAGIATQMVVERLLDAEGVKRAELGREAFLDRVWDWKRESGGQITRQLRRLGASCDWANERFTMDEGFSAAVRKVFVELYRQGLLYRDKRLVNWDPKLLTAISDLEVEMREVDGHLWHFRYPLEDGTGFIAIATTRPETILGDGAVAVHPDDDRYRRLVGKLCRLPIVERLIPIIADPHVEMDFGSGAVKITAAHDFNDFAVRQRHPQVDIPLINLMTPDAHMNDACPEGYRGLTREEARTKVVADFDALGLLDRVEPHRHNVPHGDRSGVVIEPYLTDQWYVNAAKLAEAPMAAVRSGETRFVPATWEKTFFQWMENIQPWCVSRQLWWGHRIPAWYAECREEDYVEDNGGPDYEIVVETEAEAEVLLHKYYRGRSFRIYDSLEEWLGTLPMSLQERVEGPEYRVLRDPDVLDTWFSSALWPFATIGWADPLPAAAPPPSPASGRGDEGAGTPLPHGGRGTGRASGQGEGSLLHKHYPNSVLITGFDIIFFWVARMQMMGHHIMGEAPFSTVYCHGLVRDSKGQKMSKSRGNTVDPLGLIDKYGADALRFFMAAMESQGRDIKMSEPRLEGYRNFATKLWNAARFAQANGIGGSDGPEPPPAENAVNRWIVAETQACAHAVTSALETYRFDEAANAVYAHGWGRFCDWYLELTKPILSEPGPVADETRAVAGWALDQILVMLHPFMPFITEELWHALRPRAHDLIIARWPEGVPVDGEAQAPAAVDLLIRLIEGIRAARAELNVPAGARLALHVTEADKATAALVGAFLPALERLARVSALHFAHPPEGGAAQIVLRELTASLPLEGVIDLAAERARLIKSRDAAAKEAASLSGRLDNPGFLAKADPQAVAKARDDLAARRAEAARLSAALERLG